MGEGYAKREVIGQRRRPGESASEDMGDESENPRALGSSIFPCWNNTFSMLSQVQSKGQNQRFKKTCTQGRNGQEDLSPAATFVIAHLKWSSSSTQPKYTEQSAE